MDYDGIFEASFVVTWIRLLVFSLIRPATGALRFIAMHAIEEWPGVIFIIRTGCSFP
jgi:hypothetical protein